MPETNEEKKKIRASKNRTWKRGYRSKAPSKSMKLRANALILSVILLSATALTVNLGRIMLLKHDDYLDMANSRQFGTSTLRAQRGSIYDANGAVLAQSATVYKIFLDPGLFRTEMELVEKRNKELVTAAEKKKASGQNVKADIVSVEELKEQLIVYLVETLEIDEAAVRKAFEKDSHYVVLKKQVEKNKADRIMEYIGNIRVAGSTRSISIGSVSREPDTKRYYPQNELAASVIGFNNAEGHGIYGVEAYYDSYLSGIDGKVITARDANGNDMPYRYSKTYAAQDGDDVYMTIDMTLQTYLEDAITDMVSDFNVGKRACGIMLNAKTGAVLAMASVGGFDLNEPYEIYNPSEKQRIEAIIDEDERNKELGIARETQWRNKCVTETYVPGSVFKVFTASSALEENKVNYENDGFYCEGHVVVNGLKIHCSNTWGHKAQTFEEIVKNSCNPAFIQLGQRLGRDLFCNYFEAFGLTEKTGIDLPGETSSLYRHRDTMGDVELAACAYGQTNSLSPIEVAVGYAATINGGYLLKPYVVSKVVDSAGNVVLSNETTVRRQVVSEKTSAQMRKALQYVVDNNGGSNAYIKGYKIGGKSGTSQKLMGNVQKGQEEYVASYCCFAPADNPEIVLLIMADEPDKNISYYGSRVVVPYSRTVMEEALPYLGFYPEYSDEEAELLDVTVPLLIGDTVSAAEKKLHDIGLKYEILGDGQDVNLQQPITGTAVARDGTVLLNTGSDETIGKVYMPDVLGMTLSEAAEALDEAGFNYVAKGSTRDDVKVLMQSISAGTEAEKWTVVSLELGTEEDEAD
ncbi:MAG: PASTA domain-containing protein [Oscillospiraceae bacterium]|nr:PASTA domain-containing protein [Oscillospiraceae bacterium]